VIRHPGGWANHKESGGFGGSVNDFLETTGVPADRQGVTPARSDSPRARDVAAREAPTIVWMLAHTPAWMRKGGYAAAGGRLLLLFTGVVVVVGAMFLHLTHAQWIALASTSAAMVVLVVLSLLVPWRHRSLATLIFPAAALAGLGVIGLTTEGLWGSYVGLIPLAFVYTGLFHRGRAAVLLLPLACVAYVAMVPVIDDRTGVRLGIYAIAWWATAQVIALTTAYQHDLNRRLRFDARTDVLTSLANRRDLEDRLASAVPGDCVVLCDLDHFKRVNDTYGHAAGDAVLERFGHAVDMHLRRRDYAARYGGEEFVLILPRTEPVQAMNMLRALRTEWAEEGTGVTFSAGIAMVTPGVPPGSALAAADVALYRAKAAGRDRFRIATEQIGARRVPSGGDGQRRGVPSHQ
jgi:diguanylate cyclase (GGDEF)-like protein